MGCGCTSFNWASYFGRPQTNSGTSGTYSAAERDQAIYFPTSPYPAPVEQGNMGYRYAMAVPLPPPEYYRGGYQGVLPLDQQPKLEMPEPWNKPVVF